jgi:hypothetical protein
MSCRKHGGPNQNDKSAHAYVRCTGTPWKPSYVKTGKTYRITREGWVYRKARDNVWRPLTSHYFWDNNYGANIVCQDMGYLTGSRTKTRNPNNRENFDNETGNRRCHRHATDILQCRKYGGPNNNDLTA